jgi:hypothetical protein
MFLTPLTAALSAIAVGANAETGVEKLAPVT